MREKNIRIVKDYLETRPDVLEWEEVKQEHSVPTHTGSQEPSSKQHDKDRPIAAFAKSVLLGAGLGVACLLIYAAIVFLPSARSQAVMTANRAAQVSLAKLASLAQTGERDVSSFLSYTVALPSHLLVSRPKQLADGIVAGRQTSGQHVLAATDSLVKETAQQPVPAQQSSQQLSLATLPTTTVNLLRNSSFEEQTSTGQPTGWNYQLDSTTGNTFLSQEGNRSGVFGLKFVGGGTGNLGISQPDTKTVPGRTYTFSLYVKSTNAPPGSLLRFGFWDEYHNQEGQMKVVSLAATEDWTRYSFTATTPGLITDPKNEFSMIEVEGLTSGAVYLDDAQLTEGSIPVGYNSSQAYNSSYGVGDGSFIFSPAGDIYPAYAGTGQLGSATNQFTALNLTNASIDTNGNLTLKGGGTVSGGLSVGGLTVNGNTLFNSTTTSLQVSNGGTGQTSFTADGILYGNGNNSILTLAPGTSGYVLQANGTSTAPSWVPATSLGAAFSSLAGGTNIQAAMLVGSGASLDFTGVGTINASSLLDNTWVAPGAIGATTANSGAFTTLSASGNLAANGGLSVASGQNVTLSGFTPGSIPFISSSNQLAQDNNNLYWDETNKRLGVGTTTPSYALDIGNSGNLNISGKNIYLNGAQRISDSISSNYTDIRPQSNLLALYNGTNNQTLKVFDSAGNYDVALSSNGSTSSRINANYEITGLNIPLALQTNGGSGVVIGQDTGLANSGLDIEKNSLGNAALVVANTGGSGDIFTASSSGVSRFKIDKNGTVTINPANGGNYITAGAFQVDQYGNITGGKYVSSQDGNYFVDPAGTNTGNAFLGRGYFGLNTTTPLATMDIRAASGTLAIASVSGQTSFAGLVVDNSGAGDIFTASSAGSPKFVISGAGNVGIGTTTPDNLLQVANLINFDNSTSSTSLGYQAGQLNTGSSNSFVGYQSGSSNTTGNWNTAEGNQSLASNTTGSNNTANGVFAIRDNTTGGSNTADGFQALFSNTTGFNNVAFGMNALYDLNITANDGSGNNTAIGYNTGRGIVTGINNTIIGANVTGLSSTLSNNIIIADGAGNQRINVDANGNVGIGTTTPTTPLDVRVNDGISTNLLNLQFIGTGGDNFINFRNSNGLMGSLAYSYISGTPLILNGAAGNDLILGSNGNYNVTIQQSGNIGFNTRSPLAGFDFRQTGVLSLNGTVAVASISGKTSFATLVVDNSGSGDLFTASSSGLNRFVITQGGNVGVGTTTPGGSLDLEKFASNNLVINNNNSSNTWINYENNGTSAYHQYLNGNNMIFRDSVNGIDQLTLQSGGQVGIQNNNPSNALTVGTGGKSNPLSIDVVDYNSGAGGAQYLGNWANLLGAGWGIGPATNSTTDNLVRIGVLGSSSPYNTWNATQTLNLVIGGNLAVGIGTSNTLMGNDSLVVNQPNSSGDIFSASQSGNTKFVISNTGNVGIGTTTPSNTLNVVGSLCVKNSTAACAGSTAGTIYASNTTVQSADVAENYVSAQTLAPGDVIMPASDGDNQAVVKTTGAYQSQAIGVVSTNPGVTLNSDAQTDSTHPNKYPIALQGRVPVNVSSMNGVIHAGELLTTSSMPGVAMKATQAGQIIGKALEDYTNPDLLAVGKIMVFVNISWADPTVAFTADGNLSVNGQPVESTPSTTVAPFAGASSPVAPSSQLTNTPTADQFTTLSSTVSSLKSQIASMSSQLGTITDLSKQLSDLQKTVNLNQLLSGTSSQSAVPGASIANEDQTIGGNFTVLGRTVLTDLGVTGTINTGLLTINGLDTRSGTTSATINTLSAPLKFQSLAVAGVDFENGKVTIDTSGNIVTQGTLQAGVVRAGLYEANGLGDNPSVGEATIPSGASQVVIKTTAVSSTSHIFTSPEEAIDFPLGIINKQAGISFTVGVTKPVQQDTKFSWWLINEK